MVDTFADLACLYGMALMDVALGAAILAAALFAQGVALVFVRWIFGGRTFIDGRG